MNLLLIVMGMSEGIVLASLLFNQIILLIFLDMYKREKGIPRLKGRTINISIRDVLWTRINMIIY